MALLQNIEAQLEAADIPYTIAFPKRRMPRLLEPAVVLAISGETVEPFCLANYLGKKGTAPFYALQLNETVTCEIYSPYLSGGYQCDILTENVFINVYALLNKHKNFLVERKPTYYDPDTDCFRSSVAVRSVTWVKCPIV